jgi:hypothetical protein
VGAELGVEPDEGLNELVTEPFDVALEDELIELNAELV